MAPSDSPEKGTAMRVSVCSVASAQRLLALPSRRWSCTALALTIAACPLGQYAVQLEQENVAGHRTTYPYCGVSKVRATA